MTDLFFVYCPESGFDCFLTLDAALDEANDRIPNHLYEGWSEDVTSVCVGKITHRAKMCDQVFPDGEIDEDGNDEAGEHWDSDWDYKCNYKIQPVKPAEQQPAECTLNSDREQVTEVEAPSHSLPKWSECNLRVGNSKWLKDNDIEADHDSLTANPLHEFIYEYDDSDAYKSAWFLHRLENLIGFIRSERHPSPDAALVEALESAKNLIANHSGEVLPDNYAGDQIEQIDAALATHRKQGGGL